MAIFLKWTNKNTKAAKVEIFRSETTLDANSLSNPIATINDNNVTTYKDTTVEFGKTYYYMFKTTVDNKTFTTVNIKRKNIRTTGPGNETIVLGDSRLGYFGKVQLGELFNIETFIRLAADAPLNLARSKDKYPSNTTHLISFNTASTYCSTKDTLFSHFKSLYLDNSNYSNLYLELTNNTEYFKVIRNGKILFVPSGRFNGTSSTVDGIYANSINTNSFTVQQAIPKSNADKNYHYNKRFLAGLLSVMSIPGKSFEEILEWGAKIKEHYNLVNQDIENVKPFHIEMGGYKYRVRTIHTTVDSEKEFKPNTEFSELLNVINNYDITRISNSNHSGSSTNYSTFTINGSKPSNLVKFKGTDLLPSYINLSKDNSGFETIHTHMSEDGALSYIFNDSTINNISNSYFSSNSSQYYIPLILVFELVEG